MTPKTKKILWVVIPITVAAGIFAIWYKMSNKVKKVYVSPSNPASTPSKTTVPAASSTLGQFPLQKGSRGTMVKTLQQALGITADGIFGSQTQAALQSQFGVTSVPNQDTLTSYVNAASNGSTVRTTAQNLYDKFTNGSYDVNSGFGSYDIQVNNNSWAEAVNEDSSGKLTPNGSGFNLIPGQVYDNGTYQLDGVTMLGQLILKVTDGQLQGEYLIDPSAISLVTHNTVSVVPTTDPNTGISTF